MKKKKRYYKPEVKVVELSFNVAQLAVCHTPTVTYPHVTFPENLPCSLSDCMTP